MLTFDLYGNYYYSYHSEQIPTDANKGNGYNYLRLKNPEMDAAIDVLAKSIKPADQIQAAYKIQQVYIDQIPEVVALLPQRGAWCEHEGPELHRRTRPPRPTSGTPRTGGSTSNHRLVQPADGGSITEPPSAYPLLFAGPQPFADVARWSRAGSAAPAGGPHEASAPRRWHWIRPRHPVIPDDEVHHPPHPRPDPPPARGRSSSASS